MLKVTMHPNMLFLDGFLHACLASRPVCLDEKVGVSVTGFIRSCLGCGINSHTIEELAWSYPNSTLRGKKSQLGFTQMHAQICSVCGFVN
jgi:hypothetical protein